MKHTKKMKNTKNFNNTEHEPSNMGSKIDQIWFKQRYVHVINYVRINNLVSIHIDYH